MRAAYEAVYAERPLVVSDWPILRELFPMAVHAAHTVEGLAEAILTARASHHRLVQQAGEARAIQLARFQGQLEELTRLLGLV